MPITNHVTSLELSRRLKELGVPQKSVFWWIRTWGECSDGEPDVSSAPAQYEVSQNKKHFHELWGDGCYSAYLASELGEFIGNALENGEDNDLPEELQPTTFQDIWNPDYLAKLLIWLIENHLISVEELGK